MQEVHNIIAGMFQDLKSFISDIAPFRSLWVKLRMTSAIVRQEGQWVSISTRITLSHRTKEKSVVFRPTKDFIAFSIDIPISKLESLLEGILRDGKMKVRLGGKNMTVLLKVPDPTTSAQTQQQIYCGPPYSTRYHEYDCSFKIGESHIRMTNMSLDSLYKFFSGDQRINVSSRLRTHRPRFSDIEQLFSYLNLPSDPGQHYTTLEVLAPLPFSMSSTGSIVTVISPTSAVRKIRVTGFFDTGDTTVRLKPARGAAEGKFVTVTGPIPWPAKSAEGRVFLHMGKEEIGSIKIRRWDGTVNWQRSVHEFFDTHHSLLETGLVARKDPDQFEMAVVRLLNELQIPAVWYGAKQYQDRPDLVACLQGTQNWWVLLGECTGQKPSEKFTRLITRQRELTKLLQDEVRIVPVVFTPSTVSIADKKQAQEDGIALVGADELGVLLGGVDLGWAATNVLQYLERVLYTVPNFTSGL